MLSSSDVGASAISSVAALREAAGAASGIEQTSIAGWRGSEKGRQVLVVAQDEMESDVGQSYGGFVRRKLGEAAGENALAVSDLSGSRRCWIRRQRRQMHERGERGARFSELGASGSQRR